MGIYGRLSLQNSKRGICALSPLRGGIKRKDTHMNHIKILIATLTANRRKAAATATITGIIGLLVLMTMVFDGKVREPWVFIPAGIASLGIVGLWEFRFD